MACWALVETGEDQTQVEGMSPSDYMEFCDEVRDFYAYVRQEDIDEGLKAFYTAQGKKKHGVAE